MTTTTEFYNALNEVRIRDFTDPANPTFTNRQVIYINQVPIYPKDPKTGKELEPVIEDILKKDSILEVVGNSYFYGTTTIIGTLSIPGSEILLSKTKIRVKGDSKNLTLVAPNDFEKSVTLILPANAPTLGDALIAGESPAPDTFQLNWETQKPPTDIIVEDFLFDSPWDTKHKKNVKYLNNDNQPKFNLSDDQLRFGIAEIKQEGLLKIPSTEKLILESTFDTVITFRVKTKNKHDFVGHTDTLENVRSFDEYLSNFPIGKQGDVTLFDTSIIGNSLSGKQEKFIVRGDDEDFPSPLYWEKAESSIFLGIGSYGFTLDPLGAISVEKIYDLKTGAQISVIDPVGYSSNIRGEKISVTFTPPTAPLENFFTITSSGTTKKFKVPTGMFNLNVLLSENVLSFKVNEFIISQITLNKQELSLMKSGEITVVSKNINYYIDLLKISQVKKLNDTFGGNTIHL